MPLDYSKWDSLVDSDDDGVGRNRSESSNTIPQDDRRKNSEQTEETLSQALMLMPCHHCGKLKPRAELKKCARCKAARYCSKECQKAAWKYHQRVCMPVSQASADAAKLVTEVADVLQSFVRVPVFMCCGQLRSLASIGKWMVERYGQGFVSLNFVDGQQCEDFLGDATLAFRNAKLNDGVWQVQTSVCFPQNPSFLSWPAGEAAPLPEDAEQQVGASMHVAAGSPSLRFVCCLQIDGSAGASQYFLMNCAAAHPGVEGKPLCIAGKGLPTLDASDASRQLARKIQADAAYEQCRKLLFIMQNTVKVKGVFFLRHLRDPEQAGYRAQDLRVVTPRALKRALRAEVTKMTSASGWKLSNVSPVVFYPLERRTYQGSGNFFEELQHCWPEMPRDEILADTELRQIHMIFITWPDDASDLCIKTPFVIEA